MNEEIILRKPKSLNIIYRSCMTTEARCENECNMHARAYDAGEYSTLYVLAILEREVCASAVITRCISHRNETRLQSAFDRDARLRSPESVSDNVSSLYVSNRSCHRDIYVRISTSAGF